MAISSMVREFVFFGQHCGQFCFFSNGTAVTGRRAILLWHRPVLSESYEPRWLWTCIHVYTIRVHTVYEHLEVRRHSSRHLWCGQATPLLKRRAAILGRCTQQLRCAVSSTRRQASTRGRACLKRAIILCGPISTSPRKWRCRREPRPSKSSRRNRAIANTCLRRCWKSPEI